MDAKKLKRLRTWVLGVPNTLWWLLWCSNMLLSLYNMQLEVRTKAAISMIVLMLWTPFMGYYLNKAGQNKSALVQAYPTFMPKAKMITRYRCRIWLDIVGCALLCGLFILFTLAFNS